MEQEPTNNSQQKAAEKLSLEGKKLFFERVEKEGMDNHLSFLVEILEQDDPSLKALFDYGIAHLPADDKRPNTALASFFFFISEIALMPEEAQSFAADLMVFCEEDQYSPPVIRRENILQEFEKVKPLLA